MATIWRGCLTSNLAHNYNYTWVEGFPQAQFVTIFIKPAHRLQKKKQYYGR